MNIDKLEKEPLNWKTHYLGIVHIAFYFIISMLPSFFNIESIRLAYIVIIIAYFLTIIISIAFFRKRLISNFKYFKDHFKNYFSLVIVSQGVMMLGYFLIMTISILLLGSSVNSINQQSIEQLPVLILIFSSVLYSPLVEELVFRGSIRRLINNDWLFVILSGCLFGFLHTISEPTFVEFILRGLPYVWVGLYFAYMYTKTENIMVPIFSHFLHNTIAVLLLLLSGSF